MNDLIEKIVILRKNQLFEGLQINELMHLARITVKIDIPENQLIINEGGMGDELFILVEGSVKVYTGNRVLDTLGPGSCIGELSIIDEEPRSANVKTISHAKILSIKRRDFLLTLKENPSMSIKTMQVITHRLRKLIVQQD